MRQWADRLEPKSPGWFALVTAAAAVVVVFCGSALGLGGEPAVGDVEPLSLTLSAPPTCETPPPQGYSGSRLRPNADGGWTRVDVFDGWFGVGETSVVWSVSGGVAPYKLTIDGETRDPAHAYLGSRGTASVTCAMTSGAQSFTRYEERGFNEKPEVDSGVKTIRAMVTDAAGTTAEATVDVYVILELGSTDDRLEGGKTYRVFGNLITVPKEVDLVIGGFRGASFSLHVVGSPSSRIALDEFYFNEVNRWVVDAPHYGPSGDLIDLHAKFDELVASIGRLPSAESNHP